MIYFFIYLACLISPSFCSTLKEAFFTTLNKENGIDVNVSKVEHIGENYVAHVDLEDRTLFVVSKEEISEGANKLSLDFTRISFSRNEEVVQKAISSYDKVDAIFMNHLTVKQFVGEKYDSVIEDRVNEVNAKYQPQLAKLQEEYNANVEASKSINAKEVTAKNAPVIAQRKQEVKDQIMYEICKCKFTQHPDLREMLVRTGDQELIEGQLKQQIEFLYHPH